MAAKPRQQRPQIQLLLLLPLLLLCLATISSSSSAATAVEPQPTTPLTAAAAQKALERMMAAKLYGPEEVLKLAAKPSPAPRNYKTLAQRLSSPGEKVKVVAFGGSVTAGYGLNDRRQNWAQQLTNWLAAAFPEAQLRLSNLARDGTTIAMAESCWYQYTPQDADLILIDFNLNSCSYSTCRSVVAPQIAAYENLIRRLISQAPNAALLSFEAFAFGSYNVNVAGGGTATMPMPYYNSGEDMHAMVAARYGVPLVSARDALYDLLWQEGAVQLNAALGVSRSSLLQDNKHPTHLGSRLYGRGLAAFAVRQLLSKELQEMAAGVGDQAAGSPLLQALQQQQQQQGYELPAAISPLAAQYADLPTFCAEGEAFQSYVITGENNTVDGWEWLESSFSRGCDLGNCRVVGYSSATEGKPLQIQINTAKPAAAAAAAAAADLASSRRRRSTAGSPIRLNLLVFTGARRISRDQNVGQGRLECVASCSCWPATLGAFRENSTEVQKSGITSVQVTAHPECTLQVTAAGSGWVQLLGVAVVPFFSNVALTSVDSTAMEMGL
uniref:SGNH hydrolase-type esterase domain-containing protein n=1 Tax=Tetradesmus obliquus TaxID=3088 RepID=A0A383VYB4_TETOB|eukprot:jgi/Sobl393_1/12197/SZX69823.1